MRKKISSVRRFIDVGFCLISFANASRPGWLVVESSLILRK